MTVPVAAVYGDDLTLIKRGGLQIGKPGSAAELDHAPGRIQGIKGQQGNAQRTLGGAVI